MKARLNLRIGLVLTALLLSHGSCAVTVALPQSLRAEIFTSYSPLASDFGIYQAPHPFGVDTFTAALGSTASVGLGLTKRMLGDRLAARLRLAGTVSSPVRISSRSHGSSDEVDGHIWSATVDILGKLFANVPAHVYAGTGVARYAFDAPGICFIGDNVCRARSLARSQTQPTGSIGLLVSPNRIPVTAAIEYSMRRYSHPAGPMAATSAVIQHQLNVTLGAWIKLR